MLVIDRRRDEVVDLILPNGDVIEIMVVYVSYGGARRVKLGLTAPENVRVLRRELREATETR
jgi:carbon storage regulator CsrA